MPFKHKLVWLGNTLLIITVTLVIVVVVVMVSINSSANVERMTTQVRANLHEIQLAVERYGIDHEGAYPPYLIGGEVGSAGREMASDPLLREGYIDVYPRNPFSRPRDQYKRLPVLELQQQLSKSTVGIDPLRPGYPEGRPVRLPLRQGRVADGPGAL